MKQQISDTKFGVVLTADLVDSTHHPAAETKERLAGLLAKLEKEADWLLKPEAYRGDSFQGVLSDYKRALDIALLSRTWLKAAGTGWDLRIAIGVGAIEVLTDRPGTSDGEAFRLSGQLADRMKDERARIAVALPVPAAPVQAVLFLLEAIVEKWTPAQAEVIFGLISGSSMAGLSETLNISQPAVSQRVQAARWWAVEPLLRTFDQFIRALYPHD